MATPTQPAQDDVVASLAAAADAARQVYMAAAAANPGADLSKLYMMEMSIVAAWSTAETKALQANAAVAKAQKDLDTQTGIIRSEIASIKNLGTWLSLVDSLVKLATTVAGFFA